MYSIELKELSLEESREITGGNPRLVRIMAIAYDAGRAVGRWLYEVTHDED